MSAVAFGTDGIRGPAGTWPIDCETALAVGRAAARLAREQGSFDVIVARDTRESGAMLAAACQAGIASQGCRALDAGVAPTPALAIGVEAMEAGAGVMITASHNPWSDNGFKVLATGGRKPTAAQVLQIEGWLADSEGGAIGPVIDVHAAVLQGWLTRLQAVGMPPGRIAIDLAEGAALAALPWLSTLDVVLVRGDRINDGVGSEHPGRLAHIVQAEGCIAGIAVDGDADRCVLVDEAGRVVHGDRLIWWLAKRMQVQALAVTVMSSGALAPALPGVALTVTPVGDKHLQAAMRDAPIPLGGEESGHVLFADHPGGDGLLVGLRALAGLEVPLSEALAPFDPWPRVKSKIRVSARPELTSVAAVQEAIQAGEEALGDGGRVFLRYSGTEPVLRILVEGRDSTTVETVAAEVERIARAVL